MKIELFITKSENRLYVYEKSALALIQDDKGQLLDTPEKSKRSLGAGNGILSKSKMSGWGKTISKSRTRFPSKKGLGRSSAMTPAGSGR